VPHVTRLLIDLTLDSTERIEDVVSGLPEYCTQTFQEHSPCRWHGEFVVTCPVAPKLADGDFVDDFAPYFPRFLRLTERPQTKFRLEIAVGSPAPETFSLPSNMVSLIAVLGADIDILANPISEGAVSKKS